LTSGCSEFRVQQIAGMFQPGYFRVHAVTLWNAPRLPPRVYLEPRGKGSRDCAN
jgi:hypothetical protein